MTTPARSLLAACVMILDLLARVERPAILDWLERVTIDSPLVRWFTVHVHRQAFVRALAKMPRPRRVAIVGGGLFPRTVLALRPLLPDAELTVIDASGESIAIAREHLARDPDGERSVRFVQSPWSDRDHEHDLVIFPLAYVGDREALYRRSRATHVVHDWVFHPRGDRSELVSVVLLKRLNIVDPA